jgi:hypothetical protein
LTPEVTAAVWSRWDRRRVGEWEDLGIEGLKALCAVYPSTAYVICVSEE